MEAVQVRLKPSWFYRSFRLRSFRSSEHHHLKNGGLLKTFRVKANDLSYADSALICRTQELTANAIRKLGGNFILNVDFIRQKVNDVEDCEYKGNDKAKKLYLKRKEFLRPMIPTHKTVTLP